MDLRAVHPLVRIEYHLDVVVECAQRVHHGGWGVRRTIVPERAKTVPNSLKSSSYSGKLVF